MTHLLDETPYAARDDAALIGELEALTRHHLQFCAPYTRVFPGWHASGQIADLPFLHVSAFKHVAFRTDFEGAHHERVLRSSSTTGAAASQITLDRKSSALQSASSRAILGDFLGTHKAPLLIADSVNSLRVRGEMSARVSAALSLQPLGTELIFVLQNPQDARSFNDKEFREVLSKTDEVLFYGFTWILWQTWNTVLADESLRELVKNKRFRFVHSGGWKRLEAERVDRAQFEDRILTSVAPGSLVLDYYGLVEQNGIVFPLCAAGARHVPRWADVLVREPYSLSRTNEVGLLQLVNVLAWGAPYHSVLTEDLGRMLSDDCACGRQGRRFELVGRLPKAEVRGCANV